MTDHSGIPPLAAEFDAVDGAASRHARVLPSHPKCVEREHGSRRVPDLPALFQQMSTILKGFAPRDLEIQQLLSRFES